MSDDLLFRSASELAGLVRDGELSARELVQASLDRIEAVNPELNAFVDVFDEDALAAADAIAPGDERPFAGVPIAIKNNRPIAGKRLTTAPSSSVTGRRPTTTTSSAASRTRAS
jgi:amidase